MQESPIKNWHNLNKEEVAEILGTDLEMGLTKEESLKRRKQWGLNVITKKKEQHVFVQFLLQFHQPLIYILILAAAFTFYLKEYIDSLVIFAVVLINAIVGFVQESKAKKAIDALAKELKTECNLIRNGKKMKVDAEKLVAGDVVLLKSGDRIPADMRFFQVNDLKVDESALTGESVAVEKTVEIIESNAVLGDRYNMGYATSIVTYGTGKGVVTATGDASEVGKISGSIADAVEIKTPLTKKIAHFSKILLFAILGLSAATFILGIFQGRDYNDMFMASIALAVGAIPEGLPAAITIMLSIGVSKMAKKKAIIRKLLAVETLGSTTVICSDKTGTLTENQMTVKKIFAGNEFYKVIGQGYEPEGKILKNKEAIRMEDEKILWECLLIGVLCNDSYVKNKNGRREVVGDPTEGALLIAGKKAGLKRKELELEFKRIHDIPFESEHQYMATLHENKNDGSYTSFVKGSVESIVERCSEILVEEGITEKINKAEILEIAARLSSEGLRVLAFAKKNSDKDHISHADINNGMVFIGLQGMIDPPREEVKKAVATCQSAGIQVKMITGDHALTASTIASEIGLQGKSEQGRLIAITGKELSNIDDQSLIDIAENTAVFARVSPDQKLRLVKALQAQRHIVAMTGDGVNDGPALKQADIGIAMGISGTDVAKDASDMVLLDDNFTSIEHAVEEGRNVFDNLVKYIVWILPTNLGQGLVILTAVIVGTILIASPVQILWVNMTTALLLGLMLALEPKEVGLMERPPRNPHEPILTKDLIMRTLLVGFILLVAAYGLFMYEYQSLGASLEQSRSVSTSVFIVLQSFYLLNCRSLVRPFFPSGFLSNPWIFMGIAAMLVFQLAFVYLPFMNTLFGTAPIGLMSWVRVLLAGFALYFTVELEKWIRHRYS